MFSLARPVVRLRPASKRSIWSPAITNVLIPRRSPLNVGPPIVPSRTTFNSDSPPLVVTVWARGVASARTTARAIRDESRMLPPRDRMPERGAFDDLGKSRPQAFRIDRNIHARTVMVNSANHWHEPVSRRPTQHGPWTPRENSQPGVRTRIGSKRREWLAALDDLRDWLIREAA